MRKAELWRGEEKQTNRLPLGTASFVLGLFGCSPNRFSSPQLASFVVSYWCEPGFIVPTAFGNRFVRPRAIRLSAESIFFVLKAGTHQNECLASACLIRCLVLVWTRLNFCAFTLAERHVPCLLSLFTFDQWLWLLLAFTRPVLDRSLAL
ncbi:hypothetical protein V9T40_014105 [Parthenolecanium corni]|uniref:Uncharacterized protein n=1 Tax=Parthenolecanium corni TaxID=536013 RepID=A0AAN9TCB5_9HEMI